MVAEALVCGGANSAWISQYYESVLDSVSASASFSGGTIYASAVNSTAITTVATGQSPVSLAMRSDGSVYWLDIPQNTLPTISENAGSLKLGFLSSGGTWNSADRSVWIESASKPGLWIPWITSIGQKHRSLMVPPVLSKCGLIQLSVAQSLHWQQNRLR